MTDDLLHALGCADVSGNEQLRMGQLDGSRSSRGDYRCAGASEALHDRFAHALGPPGYQGALALEFHLGGIAHSVNSIGSLTPRISRGAKRSSTTCACWTAALVT